MGGKKSDENKAITDETRTQIKHKEEYFPSLCQVLPYYLLILNTIAGFNPAHFLNLS